MTPEEFAAQITDHAQTSTATVRLPDHEGTWGDLVAAADDAANWLARCAIGRGDVVAVVADAGIGTVATILGTWRLGATVTVLAAPAGVKRLRGDYSDWLRERLRQLDAALLVHSIPGLETDWPATESGPHGMWARRSPVAPRTAEPHEEPPPVILQLTSGSTGDQKIVPVTARAALSNVDATARRLGLCAEDSVVSWLPLNHDMGLIGTFVLPALHGLALRLSTPDAFVRSPMTWVRELSDARASLTFAPHFAYGLLARYGERRPPAPETDLSALRHCVNGSEPINGAEFEAFGAWAAKYGMPLDALRPGYGMAELGLVFSMVQPGRPVRTVMADPNSLVQGATVRTDSDGSAVVGCGTPLPGYRVGIRGKDGAVLAEGTVGEICVHGPSLFAGYPGIARDRCFWPDGYYRTGDLGFLRDGEIFVCGRLKDVIIVRGENLVPQDIERSVAELDDVRAGNVAAFGIQRQGAEAVVVVAESSKPSTELRAKIAERVRESANTRPADVVLLRVGQLPKTTSGKLQRQLSKQTYLEGAWTR